MKTSQESGKYYALENIFREQLGSFVFFCNANSNQIDGVHSCTLTDMSEILWVTLIGNVGADDQYLQGTALYGVGGLPLSGEIFTIICSMDRLEVNVLQACIIHGFHLFLLKTHKGDLLSKFINLYHAGGEFSHQNL